MKGKIIFITIFLILGTLTTFSQDDYSSSSSKAIRHFKKAVQFYDTRNNNEALKELDKALDADSKFIEVFLLKADIFTESNDYNQVVENLLKVLQIKPEGNGLVFFNLGSALIFTCHYNEALDYLNKYLGKGEKPELQKKALRKIAQCEFAIRSMKKPVPFQPVNLGNKVNTKYDDYMPSLTADEETVITTVDVPIDNFSDPKMRNVTQEDFYFSHFIGGEWIKSKPFGEPLNTDGNEGAPFISSDGQILLFTACNRSSGYGSCDLYYSFKRKNSWSEPENLGSPVNSKYWESQPSLSSDGKTLYFTSNRSGGKGGMDLWMSVLGDDGHWSKPQNLGDSINTADDEMSPFIHPDNRTLYFSSNGWPGMGDFDIFISRKNPNNQWSTPVNLGYPINTCNEESYLVVNAKGDKAYFSTEREGSQKKDIFTFDLYKEAKPILTTYVKGKITDPESGVPIEAKIELIDIESNNEVARSYSNNSDGEYLICLPVDRNYALNISKDGYLFHSENFSLKNLADPSKPYQIDVKMNPIKVGEKVILKNIFFAYDKFELLSESTTELDKLVDFLRKNPEIKIEISGHTDNIGSDSYNQMLSENRSKAVNDYLVSHGIVQLRLTYKGCGKTQPIASNDTEEGRQQNRRTEFKIIDK